ncbi:hypothetical protein K402DRAFT_449034 [Aulographum hederae CBS 113979]|uniref:Ras modification protein ERF4 n=1 Tax=Aulographum hederae CBS 113979 TaxID=1176131 RepID=A0A6G1GM77_9PEZI|nr:hypothetical protein K402DRAFT_449034 [Aulographum hederae CBS 113979]
MAWETPGRREICISAETSSAVCSPSTPETTVTTASAVKQKASQTPKAQASSHHAALAPAPELQPPTLPSPTFQPPSEQPARWSLTNRIFNLASLTSPRNRAPASRLWNPVNSSPRTPTTPQQFPNIPVDNPLQQPAGGASPGGREEYPLLTLPEQTRNRLSLQGAQVGPDFENRSSNGNNSRTSIGLPRNSVNKKSAIEDTTAGAESTEGTSSKAPSASARTFFAIPSSTHYPYTTTSASSSEAGPGPSTMASAAARAAGVVEHQPSTDPEATAPATHRLRSQISRASLPASLHTNTPGDEHPDPLHPAHTVDEDGEEEEYVWGPSHPCFPHVNPHVPIASPLHQTTRIIRVRRDWLMAGDTAPTFANLYPEVLDPLVSEQEFRGVIKHVNETLVDAFSPWSGRAWLDAILGVATFWAWDDLGMTGVKGKLDRLERWLEEWNQRVGEREGVKVIPLRRTGYLTLDIQMPDPHIGAEDDMNMSPNPASPAATRRSEHPHTELPLHFL